MAGAGFQWRGVLCALVIGAGWGFSAAAADPQSAGASADATQVTAEAAAQSFDVHEFRVLGNTVLSSREIEQVLYPYLGDAKNLSDLNAAKDALEKSYHDHGFQTVFVDIPPQDIPEGIVRLRVTEGHVRERSISGARYYSERRILSGLPQTQPGTVPNFNELQRELATVNAQTSDRTVQPILKAGPVPGTTDLALKVEDHLPLHGSLELNDQYTADTKPLRATAGLSYSNLFAQFDSISVQYQLAPQKLGQVGVFQAGYSFHPIIFGIQPFLSYTNSSSSFAAIGTLGIIGKGQIIGGRLNFPIQFDPEGIQAIALGLDYKHFRNSINVDSGTGLVTPISYVNASLQYNGIWHHQLDLASFSLGANFGPRGFANDPNAFENDRFLSRSNYFYLRTDASIGKSLPARFFLKFRVSGQLALEPLVSNEQFSIAGTDGVRGYLEAEELGDRAIKATVQLQVTPITFHSVQYANFFGFFDAGRSSNIDPLPNEPAHSILRSAGAGLDFMPGWKVTGSLIWAHVLADGVSTHSGDSRFLFDLRGAF